MTRRWIWALITVNLLALIALIFMYPHLMVSPGAVIAEHAEIATDCFACHAPLRGASAARCISCHALPDIGVRTTKGVTIVSKANQGKKVSFHQELVEQNCMACHSDHAGPKLTQKVRKPFSHSLLRTAVREQCQTCHKVPDNALHRKVSGSCTQCHSQNAWKPATFDHDKSFVLDGDHNVACNTCHVNNDYQQYTCYGCHEHTVQNVLREHRDEGIRNLDNCVRCHKSANGEGEGDD
jgi:hypothetical protein